MNTTKICLVRNPFVSVKLVNKLDQISEIPAQAWAIGALLEFAISTAAVTLFLTKLFVTMGFDNADEVDSLVKHAVKAITTMSTWEIGA